MVTKNKNISVVIRVRPLCATEKEQDIPCTITTDQTNTHIALIHTTKSCATEKCFQFDKIFLSGSTQYDVYNFIGVPIVETVFDGYNGTIFAYGQTGTGKTYTMTGTDMQGGLLPKTFAHIFNKIATSGEQRSFAITATYLEIYNEEIRDLLSAHPNAKLQLRERTDIGIYVKDLTGYTVDKYESMIMLLKRGNANRATRCTALNDLSSRSHVIFTIIIEAKDKQMGQTTIGKLNLVDLAGSERLSRSGATGSGIKEAGNINQSLFCLSNVISALVQERCSHIPYRNSKLTRLLQDSLGGNSGTAMIATVSPSLKDYEETLCTLRYATKTKCVVNSLRQNIQIKSGLIESFEHEIAQLQERLAAIALERENAITKCERKSRISDTNLGLQQIEVEKQNLNQKIMEIQTKILVGGKNLFEEARKQENLIEKSTSEILNLRDHELLLGEKIQQNESERIIIENKYSTLQEENDFLDKNIGMLQKNLLESENERANADEEHQQDLEELVNINRTINRELQLVNKIIETYVPPKELEIIDNNMHWNPETTDFQINHVAYTGNNVMRPVKKNKKESITAKIKNPYRSYGTDKNQPKH